MGHASPPERVMVAGAALLPSDDEEDEPPDAEMRARLRDSIETGGAVLRGTRMVSSP